MRAPAALLAVVAAAIGCRDAAPPASTLAPPLAPFTVRGRLDDRRELAVSVESLDGPAPLDAPVARALRLWEAVGPLRFRPAGPEDEEAIVFAWRRGAHPGCAPFGSSPERAHAGPVAAASFVHFDAEREWDEQALFRAAAHELGHVLGLGHGDAPDSLLQPDPSSTIAALSDADRCGLHSLYGGGQDRPGDVRVLRADGTLAATLRRVAPLARSELALFDTDGDGDDELCVWRTDREGHGTLTCWHFAPGPRLERSVGPLYGATSPTARAGFATDAAGQRLFVSEFADGRRSARTFDERGLFRAGAPPDLPAPEAPRLRGDLDGDGAPETVEILAGAAGGR